MIGVVQADAEKIGNKRDRDAEPWLTLDFRQGGRIDGGQLCELGGRELIGRQVRDLGGQVSNTAVLVQKTRLFRSTITISHQTHRLFSH